MKESLWMVDQLLLQGVRHFCMAPGSRSTPLVLAIKEHPDAKLHIHYDERGLGFYALGIAKACQEPVALIVTSGTAVGNLMPAVMEAHHSQTPLLLLTADRPIELRDCGANQTTDQVKFFSSFTRWQIDLPPNAPEKLIRSIAAQAVAYMLQNTPGPVHINCAFQDPLYLPHPLTPKGTPIVLHLPELCASYQTNKAHGVILIGRLPNNEVEPILQLAQRLKWPVLADILSNARDFPAIRYHDFLNKPKPEIVLHFGDRMTSKKILQWLEANPCEYLHISPYSALQDPLRMLTGRIQSDISYFCSHFQALTDPTWLPQWQSKPPQLQETGHFTEIHAMRALSELIPAGFAIFLGNGMPIRDADQFLFPKHPTLFYANRGLSGIDGNIATIAGLAEKQPTLGIIGDQAALHDLNSLPLLKKTKFPALLLIFNNFGGGIFHHLPIAKSPHFEELWAANHTLRFVHAAQMFDLPYHDFHALNSLFQNPTPAVIELITCRHANHNYAKSISAEVEVEKESTQRKKELNSSSALSLPPLLPLR